MRVAATIIAIVSILALSSCSSVKQPMGYFVFKKGDTTLEEFELRKDNTFSTWLHQRLEYTGTWSMENNTVSMIPSVDLVPIVIEVISLEDDVLIVRFNELENTATFLKVE